MKNENELNLHSALPQEIGTEDIEVRDSDDDEGYDPDYDDSFIPEYLFTNPDPYYKIPPFPADHPRHNYWFDTEGHIWVKNLSAYWLPNIAFEEEIGGTVFSVSAFYTGTETLDKKLERLMAEAAKDSLKGGDH